MSNLIIAEYDPDGLKLSTRAAITAAVETGGDIDVLLIGKGIDPAKSAAVAGVSKLLVVDSPDFENPLAEAMTPVVMQFAKSYRRIWAGADSFGKNLMPRVAALMDVQQISDITAVKGDNVYERPIYAGNAISTVQSTQDIDVITVRATAFEPAADEGGSASVETVSPDTGDQSQSAYVGSELSSSERPELTSARVVVSGGRGMQAGENFVMLERVADKLGAAVGASRAAVDAGYVPNDYQVGQTGKVVAPELYIAVGISGAIQHLAGMKDSKVIVAINKDEEAPIFQVADYGLVADLFQALPELEAELG